jgi:hypothetical protein
LLLESDAGDLQAAKAIGVSSAVRGSRWRAIIESTSLARRRGGNRRRSMRSGVRGHHHTRASEFGEHDTTFDGTTTPLARRAIFRYALRSAARQ